MYKKYFKIRLKITFLREQFIALILRVLALGVSPGENEQSGESPLLSKWKQDIVFSMDRILFSAAELPKYLHAFLTI